MTIDRFGWQSPTGAKSGGECNALIDLSANLVYPPQTSIIKPSYCEFSTLRGESRTNWSLNVTVEQGKLLVPNIVPQNDILGNQSRFDLDSFWCYTIHP